MHMNKEKKRAVLIILDGFGVGAMEDCEIVRPDSVGANSFLHVVESLKFDLPNLELLGMREFLPDKVQKSYNQYLQISGLSGFGRCALKHEGADSFEGHNEIMGNRPQNPQNQNMRMVGRDVCAALKNGGYNVKEIKGSNALLIEDAVVIADNMETDPGQVINVTGSLDLIAFDKILEIGWIVRRVVKSNRVITLGGVDVSLQRLLSTIYNKGESSGIDTPLLNIYNEKYKVQHMGYGIDAKVLTPTILENSGVPVYLLGKMADVIGGDVHQRIFLVHTGKILKQVSELLKEKYGFIAATLQETDLFGHRSDVESYARVLRQVDDFIPHVIEILNDGDMFILSGDHGNDPTFSGPSHTREYVPLLVFIKNSKRVSCTNLGTRETLADIAATVNDFFGVKPPEFGKSIMECFNEG